MFGFSAVGFLVAFYVVASMLATLFIVAACVASGNSSRASDELFAQYIRNKQKLAAATAPMQGGHSLPVADHRFLPAEEVEIEEKAQNESVQQNREQSVENEPVRA